MSTLTWLHCCSPSASTSCSREVPSFLSGWIITVVHTAIRHQCFLFDLLLQSSVCIGKPICSVTCALAPGSADKAVKWFVTLRCHGNVILSCGDKNVALWGAETYGRRASQFWRQRNGRGAQQPFPGIGFLMPFILPKGTSALWAQVHVGSPASFSFHA